jgi:hypothetical protein
MAAAAAAKSAVRVAAAAVSASFCAFKWPISVAL